MNKTDKSKIKFADEVISILKSYKEEDASLLTIILLYSSYKKFLVNK